MDRYVHIYFGPDEMKDQREFLNAMNGIGIITIPKEDIDIHMKDFEREHTGVENHLVLHGDEEYERFLLIMKTFFPEKKYYRITEKPDDASFAKWLAEKKERIMI